MVEGIRAGVDNRTRAPPSRSREKPRGRKMQNAEKLSMTILGDSRLRGDARGRDGSVRRELAAGAMKRKPRKLLPGLRAR